MVTQTCGCACAAFTVRRPAIDHRTKPKLLFMRAFSGRLVGRDHTTEFGGNEARVAPSPTCDVAPSHPGSTAVGARIVRPFEVSRSEERRVGKEVRSRGSACR